MMNQKDLGFRVLIPLEGSVKILDQTRLPHDLVYNEYNDYRDIISAIRRLEIRGAPAIGIAGAYALAVAVEADVKNIDIDRLKAILHSVGHEIKKARPTAANLGWAVDRVLRNIKQYDGDDIERFRQILWDEAAAIYEEDEKMCAAIGRHGEELLKDGDTVLTHCNAGALATGGIGTALAPIYTAHHQGKKIKVFADETRPLLQGARLTAWELKRAGIEVTLLVDSASGELMRRGKINCVLVGADRIAGNGDVANKIGTYNIAVQANRHGVPFYVAAPYSTFDDEIATGNDIPIEDRASEEVTHWHGKRIAPDDIEVFAPAFDITPHELVTGYITEKGISRKSEAPRS